MSTNVISLSKEYLGEWIMVDWPFARLLVVRQATAGKATLEFFDVEYEHAAKMLAGRTKGRVNGSCFDIVAAHWDCSTGLCVTVRCHDAESAVDYVFRRPYGRRTCMLAESSWIEKFINVGGISCATQGKICGRWRYADLQYSSLIIEVRKTTDCGKCRVMVRESTENKVVRIKHVQISDEEVCFSLVGSSMSYHLTTKDGATAKCRCTNLNEKWQRKPQLAFYTVAAPL